jgi:RimJ/RimL family protein N-acetyltransferase
VQVRGEGLLLRPWTLDDVPQMALLFNTAEMDRWTPLAHPFDEDAAVAYVNSAHQGRGAGLLQLAVTQDGGEPLGEVLLFGTEEDRTCEFAYAVLQASGAGTGGSCRSRRVTGGAPGWARARSVAHRRRQWFESAGRGRGRVHVDR